jgi:hypothetical protein
VPNVDGLPGETRTSAWGGQVEADLRSRLGEHAARDGEAGSDQAGSGIDVLPPPATSPAPPNILVSLQ